MVQVVLFLQFALFGVIRTSPGMFRSFGFVRVQPAFIAFTLFQLIIGPLDEVSIFAHSIEHKGRLLAVQRGCLRRNMCRLQVRQLCGNLQPAYIAPTIWCISIGALDGASCSVLSQACMGNWPVSQLWPLCVLMHAQPGLMASALSCCLLGAQSIICKCWGCPPMSSAASTSFGHGTKKSSVLLALGSWPDDVLELVTNVFCIFQNAGSDMASE